jgi:hypothetical protein
MELPEHDHGIDEWKPQLAAAIFCGVFGLAGFFLPAPFKIFADSWRLILPGLLSGGGSLGTAAKTHD